MLRVVLLKVVLQACKTHPYRLMDTIRNAETPPDFVPTCANAPFAWLCGTCDVLFPGALPLEFWLPLHPVPKWENTLERSSSSSSSSSSPKPGSNVLFPSALPLASAGVTNKKPAPKCSSHALKAAPQQSPSGRLRNSKTPWP